MKQTTNVPGYITDQSVLSLRQTPDGPHKSATNPCAIAVHLKAISTHLRSQPKIGVSKITCKRWTGEAEEHTLPGDGRMKHVAKGIPRYTDDNCGQLVRRERGKSVI